MGKATIETKGRKLCRTSLRLLASIYEIQFQITEEYSNFSLIKIKYNTCSCFKDEKKVTLLIGIKIFNAYIINYYGN